MIVGMMVEKGFWIVAMASEEKIPDNHYTLVHMLKDLISTFHLLHGKFHRIEGQRRDEPVRVRESSFSIETHRHSRISDISRRMSDTDDLRLSMLLSDFIPSYLTSLNIQKLHISCATDGVSMAMIHAQGVLECRRLFNLLRGKFKAIRLCSLLYTCYILHSEISLEDMRPLYSYLVSSNGIRTIFKLTKEPFARLPTSATETGGGSSSFGRTNPIDIGADNTARKANSSFLLGVSRSCHETSIFMPDIYLSDGSVCKLCVLLVNSFMVVLLLDPNNPVCNDSDFYTDIESFLLNRSDANGDKDFLRAILPWFSLPAEAERVSGKSSSCRYLFYDKQRNILRQSHRPTDVMSAVYPAIRLVGKSQDLSKQRTGTVLSRREAVILQRSQLGTLQNKVGAIFTKEQKGDWIISKYAFGRLLYMMLPERDANDMDECFEKYAAAMAQHLPEILM
eukprot:GHVO01018517.1.p1 GENE.GHVO01018517.1~~GHVO01018517.1.p1  ORF type:complete len:496 (+),score=53.69 GHVO01018517.1:138-1490(+)